MTAFSFSRQTIQANLLRKPNKISLRKYQYKLFTEDIKAGKYTLIITAGILPGEAQLCRVTFDYKG